MKSYPDSDYDLKELSRLNASDWMVELLKRNPSYVYWGPYEDYMDRPGRNETAETNPRRVDSGWESRCLIENWESFGPWDLDTHNECVHYYFEVNRDSKDCTTCNGTGYHPDALWVSESFYGHSSPFAHETERSRETHNFLGGFTNAPVDESPLRNPNYPSRKIFAKYGKSFEDFCKEMRVYRNWNARITQDEVDKLVEHGRLHDFTSTFVEGQGWVKNKRNPTAEEVNESECGTPGKRKGMGHDAINRSILIEQRLNRFGIPRLCPDCEGHGRAFTEPEAHCSLVLWMIHPRKGASRGVEIKRINESNLPEIFTWLRQASQRNAQRFAGIQEEFVYVPKKEGVEA